jgi:hypothetical protein
MTGNRAALSLVPDEPDQAPRLERFRTAHPEVVFVPPATPHDRWRAVVRSGLIRGDGTRTTLGSWDLADLMDQLEEIYPPDGGQPGDSPG